MSVFKKVKTISNITFNTRKAGHGKLTTFETKGTFSFPGSSLSDVSFASTNAKGSGNSMVIGLKQYNRSGGYKPIYLQISETGKLAGAFEETAGLMPTLVVDADGQLWRIVVERKSEREIIIPWNFRKGFIVEPPFEFLKTRFVGAVDEFLFFEHESGGLRRVEILDKTTRSKTIKRSAKLKSGSYAVRDRQLYCLTARNDFLLDVDAQVQESTKVDATKRDPQIEIKRNSIAIKTYDKNGKVNNSKLQILPKSTPLFAITGLVTFGPRDFVFSFTFETGNGWAVIRDLKLIHCFVGGGTEPTYCDLVSESQIKLKSRDRTVISSIAKINQSYCLTFSLMPLKVTEKPNQLLAYTCKFEIQKSKQTKKAKSNVLASPRKSQKTTVKGKSRKMPVAKKTMHNTTFAIRSELAEKEILAALSAIYQSSFSKSKSKFVLSNYEPNAYKYVWCILSRQKGLFVELVPNIDSHGKTYKSKFKSYDWILNVRVNLEYHPAKDPVASARELENNVLESADWLAKIIAHPK